MNLEGIAAVIGIDIKPAMKAMDDVAKGAQGLKGKFDHVTGAISSGLGSAMEAVKGVMTDGVATIVEGIGLEKVAETISELPAIIAEKIHGAMESIEATSQAANSLGIATERYTELTYAAGQSRVSQEDLATALKMMSNNVADAATGAGTAADSLRAMGLSALQLANDSPDEAFAKIADGLSKIQNESGRTQAAMNIFGREAGPQLREFMSEGSEGIEKARQRAHELGLTFTEVDAQQVIQANKAMKDISKVIEGILQKAAIAVAPYIEGIADAFTQAATAGGGFGHYAVDAVEWVAKAVAETADNLALLEAGWYTLKAVVIAAVGGIIQEVELMAEGLAKVLALIPGMGDAAASVGEAAAELQAGADSMASDAVDAWDKAGDKMAEFASGANSAKVTKFFDDIKKSSADAAKATAANIDNMHGGWFVSPEGAKELADLQKQIDQSGMNEFQKQLDNIKRGWGQSDPLGLKDAGGKINQLEAISLKETIMTPGEKFQKAMDQINRLHDKGGLDNKDFGLLRGKADRDAFGESKLPGIMKAGSAEALAARYDASRPNPNDPLAVQRAQLAAVLEGNKQLETIASALGNITMADPVQV